MQDFFVDSSHTIGAINIMQIPLENGSNRKMGDIYFLTKLALTS